MNRALVYGFAIAGEATARALLRRGVTVVVADDESTSERRASAAELGVDLIDSPRGRELDELVRGCDIVSPAPGVPETHPVISSAHDNGVEVVSEIELAYRWEQVRRGGPRPILAITGTDGKTTTTLMVVEMLRAAGLRTIDAGNTATPLVEAIDQDLDAFVVECTSFRLAWTPTFRAEAAVWLNLAPDHLNWHRSMASYESAKAQIFANQRDSDFAIGFIDDDVVLRHVHGSRAHQLSFGRTGADYYLAAVEDTVHGDSGAGAGGILTGPGGPIASTAEMRRSLPHDITNALAAAALVLETGLASTANIAAALATFNGPPHRLEHVGTWNDIAWFNDSKATTPHAADAAIHSFDNIVLLAGGYDKGVDLSAMAAGADRIDTVIALGATAPAIVSAFALVDDVRTVADVAEAVALAGEIARPGSTVLLSPGCASFDQYGSFDLRGDHFRSLVLDAHTPSTSAARSMPVGMGGADDPNNDLHTNSARPLGGSA